MSDLPIALVYNDFFETAGGGERSALDLAGALERNGFRIVLATAHSCGLSLDQILRPFGIEPLGDWEYHEFDCGEDMCEYVHDSSVDLFVNHTYGSLLPNPARRGFYSLMFPDVLPERSRQNIETYDRVLCNSRFTEIYAHKYWGDGAQTVVLPPPISTVHERGSRVQLSEKEKLILVIGRFNVRGHNKCQLDAVRAFVELKQRAVLSSDWKLVVAGHVNPNPDNETYVEQCRRVGLGHRVEVRTNISIEELCELYRRASFLWQFTGIELPFGVDPSKCEHLGLVALDCFGYGVVPVVYQRSGVAMMLNSGQNGFVFGSTRDLAGLMGLLGTHWKAAYHQQLFNASLKMGREFSHAKFVERVGGLVY